ncbi:MAG: hypothetical protein IT380_19770 [Myxococcales bacterium]|nr:hypothetical protein [Myxococcales bacterium]
MAQRRKTKRTVGKKKRSSPTKKKSSAKRRPSTRRARAPKRPAPPAPVDEATQVNPAFDAGATQQVSPTEVVGDIEEAIALSKLTDG